MSAPPPLEVPYFQPSIGRAEIDAVVDSLESGWLTTGPRVAAFEASFAEALGCRHALALNSCTAALHLALEAIGLQRGELVLVPTLTFAATAEVVRYFDATPVFVDCGPDLCLDPEAAAQTLEALAHDRPLPGLQPPYGKVRALIAMHYGGYACAMRPLLKLCARHGIDLLEDAAHTFPAAYRADATQAWQATGSFGRVGCFSFYANKCITTGEGGMAVCNDPELDRRMRLMSLHGMDRDAWRRSADTSRYWYYEIVAPGFKYNLTDLAAAIGHAQLRRADQLWKLRQQLAAAYSSRLAGLEAVELPPDDPETRRHAWHLYPIRLRLEQLRIDRATVIARLRERGVSCSVHWLPLHLQPYYREKYGYGPGCFPQAEAAWPRLISLPLFPDMRNEQLEHVCACLADILAETRA